MTAKEPDSEGSLVGAKRYRLDLAGSRKAVVVVFLNC